MRFTAFFREPLTIDHSYEQGDPWVTFRINEQTSITATPEGLDILIAYLTALRGYLIHATATKVSP